jgi:hypothetical protein
VRSSYVRSSYVRSSYVRRARRLRSALRHGSFRCLSQTRTPSRHPQSWQVDAQAGRIKQPKRCQVLAGASGPRRGRGTARAAARSALASLFFLFGPITMIMFRPSCLG